MSDDNKITDLRERFAKVQGDTTPEATKPDEPQVDLWAIKLHGNDEKQIHGFFSFNPVGAVFATSRGGESVVEFIAPWDRVEYIERITDSDLNDE